MSDPRKSQRSLWRVLGLYAAASWVCLQVVDVLTDASHGILSYARNLVVQETLDWLDRYLGPV